MCSLGYKNYFLFGENGRGNMCPSHWCETFRQDFWKDFCKQETPAFPVFCLEKNLKENRSRMRVAFTPLTFSIPAHLESPSTHNALSGWLKRNGGLTAGKRGVPRALQSIEPCVYSCLHTSPTFFIYLLWNIYGCYERFKIMCLSLSARSFPLARVRLLMHKSFGALDSGAAH